jgi:hypothetical protein
MVMVMRGMELVHDLVQCRYLVLAVLEFPAVLPESLSD